MTDQTPAFGPAVWDELAAAGVAAAVVGLVPLDNDLYKAGTVLYAEGATDAQMAAVAKVISAYDPTKVSTIDLVAYAAQARYAKEVGGIKVGTAQIDTSRDSRSMIADAWEYMVQSGIASTKYKTDSGWVQVTADQMKAIALAVGAHVQACFAAEADLDGKIAAGMVTTTAQVDAAFAALTT